MQRPKYNVTEPQSEILSVFQFSVARTHMLRNVLVYNLEVLNLTTSYYIRAWLIKIIVKGLHVSTSWTQSLRNHLKVKKTLLKWFKIKTFKGL